VVPEQVIQSAQKTPRPETCDGAGTAVFPEQVIQSAQKTPWPETCDGAGADGQQHRAEESCCDAGTTAMPPRVETCDVCTAMPPRAETCDAGTAMPPRAESCDASTAMPPQAETCDASTGMEVDSRPDEASAALSIVTVDVAIQALCQPDTSHAGTETDGLAQMLHVGTQTQSTPSCDVGVMARDQVLELGPQPPRNPPPPPPLPPFASESSSKDGRMLPEQSPPPLPLSVPFSPVSSQHGEDAVMPLASSCEQSLAIDILSACAPQESVCTEDKASLTSVIPCQSQDGARTQAPLIQLQAPRRMVGPKHWHCLALGALLGFLVSMLTLLLVLRLSA